MKTLKVTTKSGFVEELLKTHKMAKWVVVILIKCQLWFELVSFSESSQNEFLTDHFSA